MNLNNFLLVASILGATCAVIAACARSIEWRAIATLVAFASLPAILWMAAVGLQVQLAIPGLNAAMAVRAAGFGYAGAATAGALVWTWRRWTAGVRLGSLRQRVEVAKPLTDSAAGDV